MYKRVYLLVLIITCNLTNFINNVSRIVQEDVGEICLVVLSPT